MTEIAFHFNAPDRLGYTCRLLRKAVAAGSRVLVTGDSDTLRALDELLWTFSATDFVPHCTRDASVQVLQKTPVVLAESLQNAPFHDILVNLGAQIPGGFEIFERVIEIVTRDEDERHLARQRWKQYASAGFALIRHDLQPRETP